jgi:hypothetical protein
VRAALVSSCCPPSTPTSSYFNDWLDAIRRYPGFATITVDIVRPGAPLRIKRELDDVEAVVLLHSTNGDTTAFIEPHAGILADRRVPLLTFVGNEVNLHGASISTKRRLGRAKIIDTARRLGLRRAAEAAGADQPVLHLGVVLLPPRHRLLCHQ